MGSVFKRTYRDKNNKLRKTNVWWIQYYRNGVQMRESAETVSHADAKKLLARKEADIAKGIVVKPRAGRLTFEEIAADVMNDYKANGYRSLRDLEARLRLHILPFFGSCRTSAIETSDIRAFITQRQEEGATNGTINRELTAIRRAFTLAVDDGKLLTKPRIILLKENNVRTGFFERDQFEAVSKNLPAYLRPLTAFAYITGWRKGEILNLQWLQIDFEAGTVRLWPGPQRTTRAESFHSPSPSARSSRPNGRQPMR